MVDGLIIEKAPPPNREGKCTGGLRASFNRGSGYARFCVLLATFNPQR